MDATRRDRGRSDRRLGPALAVVVLTLAACGGTQASPAPASEGPVPGTNPPVTAPASAPAIEPTPAGTATPSLAIPPSGTWARVEIDGAQPDAREDHTWTVDAEGRTAWLFGGRDGGTEFDDLWAFDLAAESWRLVDAAGDAPAARFGHEAAWVPGLGLVVFGGQTGPRFFDDLWLFDPATEAWRLLPPGGGAPTARYGSCSGIGPDGRFWISHGFTADGIRFADTLAYDFDDEAWTDQAPSTERPVERCLHACWWTSDGQLALYGGQTTGVPALGDLWLLTPGSGGAATNSWAEAPGQEPAARQLPAIARRGTATFLFGGRGTDRAALAGTWLAVDGADGFEAFEATGTEPSPRSGATLVYDSLADRLLLFGGIGREARNDLWALTFP
jgi:Galactose oxidase, central domain